MVDSKANLSEQVKLANSMIKAGHHSEAIQVLDQYLAQHPRDVEALRSYGVALIRFGDHTRAEAVFRQLAEQAPHDDRVSYNLALSLIGMGRTDEARQWLAAALKANPGLDRARQRLEALDASARKASPPPSPPLPASQAQINEHLDAGTLLRSGTRRISSFAGRFVLAAPLLVFGCFLGSMVGGAVELLIAGVPLILGALLMIYAVLAARHTRYDVYQRRIDMREGVLSRHLKSVWLYEIKDVELRQPFFLLITGNALIRLRLEDHSLVEIVGFGTSRFMEGLWEELTNAALKERRALRNWWV